MASITSESNGRRTVQFVGADKRRRSIRLGKVSQRAAEAVLAELMDAAGELSGPELLRVVDVEKSMDVIEVNISDIKIDQRARNDLGDLAGLAASIDRVGLLQPIVVTCDNVLVSGHRRLEAVRLLGRATIAAVRPGNLDETLLALQAERDENTCRKDFTASELVAMGTKIEGAERERAKERMADGGRKAGPGRPIKGAPDCAPFVEKPKRTPKRTTEAVARTLGVAPRTYEKAKTIVRAAESDPKNGDLVEIMDAKTINAAYTEMRRRSGRAPAADEKAAVKSKTIRMDTVWVRNVRSDAEALRTEVEKRDIYWSMVDIRKIVLRLCDAIDTHLAM